MDFSRIIYVGCVIVALSALDVRPAFSQSTTRDSTAMVMRFGGDLLLAGHYERSVGDDRDVAFRDFHLFRRADVAMVNLECPVTTRGTRAVKPFTFRMHPQFLSVLWEAGINIVNIANNHIHDFGDEGLFDTIAYLDSSGIRHVGAGRSHRDAHKPVVFTVKGKRIGFLGYYGGPEAPHAKGENPGVANRDPVLIERDIRQLKTKDSVHYVVVNVHWGTEKAEYPDDWQIKLGRRIIDAGADAVIGHHPHVLQGIERYKHGVIVYSLGNLVFGGNSRSNYDTAIFEIYMGDSGVSYGLIPVRIANWNTSVLTGNDADSLRMHVESLSRIFPSSIFNIEE